MGREQSTSQGIFVNISEGRFYDKEKEAEKNFFPKLSGTITEVKFEENEYNGDVFERAIFTVVDGEEKFLVQMRTDSGYFRGMCNALRTGNPTERVRLTPSYKKEGDEAPKTTIFVEQRGKTLKHFSTKDHPEDLPKLESVMFKGKQQWDGTKQVEYWKKWLSSIKWEHELFSDNDQSVEEEITASHEDYPPEPKDDLPF